MTSQLLDKAPVWLENAFEESERQYYCARKDASAKPRVPSNEAWIYGSVADAMAQSFPLGVDRPEDFTPRTLNEIVSAALRKGADWIILRDAQGNELRRWPVDR